MSPENFVIKGASDTFFTPSVNFNAKTGICELSGESYLENTVEFYGELYTWLKKYFKTGRPLVFEFKLAYFNTSSNKAILQLLNLLKGYENSGNQVKVTWHYKKDDEEMREEAEDYMQDSGLALILVGDL
jgi:hypothetical protein